MQGHSLEIQTEGKRNHFEAFISDRDKEIFFKYSLLDGDVIEFSLSSENSILMRKFTKSYQEISKSYPFLSLLYESAQDFINLIQYSAQNNKIVLVDDKTLEVKIVLGHQEKSVKFDLVYQQPTQAQLTETLLKIISRVNNIEQDTLLIKKEVQEGYTREGRRLKFSFVNPDKSQIKSSDDDQTVERIGQSGTWVGVIGNKPVYPRGKTIVEFKIADDLKNGCYTMMGFVHKKESYSGGYYTKHSSKMLYCPTGFVYSGGGQRENLSTKAQKGDTVKMVFDAEKLQIQFYVNGGKVGSEVKFANDQSEINNIFPCVDLYHITEKVTILK